MGKRKNRKRIKDSVQQTSTAQTAAQPDMPPVVPPPPPVPEAPIQPVSAGPNPGGKVPGRKGYNNVGWVHNHPQPREKINDTPVPPKPVSLEAGDGLSDARLTRNTWPKVTPHIRLRPSEQAETGTNGHSNPKAADRISMTGRPVRTQVDVSKIPPLGIWKRFVVHYKEKWERAKSRRGRFWSWSTGLGKFKGPGK